MAEPLKIAAADLGQHLRSRATEAGLSPGTLLLYERHWSALARFCLKQSVEPHELDQARADTFYRVQTDGRSASHHLGVRAALSFAFRQLRCPNPFLECVSPTFDAAKIEIAYLDQTALGRLFAVLQESRDGYFGRMTWTLAYGLFHTACRFSELALLSHDSLLFDGSGFPTILRIRSKGGRFRDLPVAPAFGRELTDWLDHLHAVRGRRLRAHDLAFATSQLLFVGRSGQPPSNHAFNARLKSACQRARVTPITAHALRHSAATLLLSSGEHSLREVQELLGHKQLSTTARYTHVASHQLKRAVRTLSVLGQGGNAEPHPDDRKEPS